MVPRNRYGVVQGGVEEREMTRCQRKGNEIVEQLVEDDLVPAIDRAPGRPPVKAGNILGRTLDRFEFPELGRRIFRRGGHVNLTI
jgi:hypothetical protein